MTDPARAGSVRATGSGGFEVPANSISASGAVPSISLTTREWIGVDGGRAQFAGSGIPVVTPFAAPPPAGVRISATEAISVDGRVVSAPKAVTKTPVNAPDGMATPPAVTFGNVPINTTVIYNVAITVDFGYRTQVASGSGNNAPFSFDFDTCGAGGGFAGPGTCNVKQSFHPTALTTSNGTTNVFECPIAGGSCIAIPYTVQGTGISAASANPSSVPFGNVPINTTATQNVTITVDAGYSTQIASGSGINAPFSFNFDTCGAGGGFAGPGTCNVKQSFNPTATTTSNGTTNVFECPIAGGSCIAIPYTVQGTGISVASAIPSNVPFGNVPINTSATGDVTITVDAGYRTQVASGSGLNAPFSFSFDTCGAGGGFAGPGTCNVKQSFQPTAITTSNGTTNVFECPIAGGSCIAIPYTEQGAGISVASAGPSNVPFGNVPINTTATQDVTITVDAGYRTEIASGTGINAPFSFNFDICGAGGGYTGPGTCNVKQSFHPILVTTSNGTTNVFECPIAGGSCIAIPYTEQGNGVAAPPVLQGAVSRRVHGAAGTFDMALALTPTNPSTEPRLGPAQTIVFTFDKPIASASVAVTEGSAAPSAPSFSGNDVSVGLSGVTDGQYVTISLTNVGSADGGTGGSASVRLGFLAGDVNRNRVVTVSDVGLVNSQLAQPVTSANFLYDVNATGTLTVADKGITNLNLTHALPPP